MMGTVEAKVRLSGGVDVEVCKLAQVSGIRIALGKPAVDQHGRDQRFDCGLAEWAEIVEAVDTLRGMLGKPNE